MKGFVRNIPEGKKFGFIKANTGLDNIFLHADNYHGDWDVLVRMVYGSRQVTPKVSFELEDGAKGPRASKCVMISEEEYMEKES